MAKRHDYTKSLASVSRWLRPRRGLPRQTRTPPCHARQSHNGRAGPRLHRPAGPETVDRPPRGTRSRYGLASTSTPSPRRECPEPAVGPRSPLPKSVDADPRFSHLGGPLPGEQALTAWCRASSGVADFVAFAKALRQDWDAVVTAHSPLNTGSRFSGHIRFSGQSR